MDIATILDSKRQKLLPCFQKLPSQFYLAGGTGLALQLGHRLSDYFDFFCQEEFDTQQLYEQLTDDIFTDSSLTIVQESTNTLDVLTENQTKLSFIRYRYPLQYKLIEQVVRHPHAIDTEFLCLPPLDRSLSRIRARGELGKSDPLSAHCLTTVFTLDSRFALNSATLTLKGLVGFSSFQKNWQFQK